MPRMVINISTPILEVTIPLSWFTVSGVSHYWQCTCLSPQLLVSGSA